MVQRRRETAPPRQAPPIVHEVLQSSGQRLDESTRAAMELRFGHDFSQVRVHTDARAEEAAHAVGARAYTVGKSVVFAAGQYQPAATAGRRLLAHELGHVVQQRRAPATGGRGPLPVSDPGDRAEREADRAAEGVVGPGGVAPFPTPLTAAAPAPALQRQPAKSTVRVDGASKELAQGKGGSGGIVYEYPAHARKEPVGETPGNLFELKLPLLVYPPATLKPPTVDIFVFFHGMRATYGEGPSQGSEPIALWTHLREAVAGTDRLGIAPQAPSTWRLRDTLVDDPDNPGKKKPGPKKKEQVTAQWREALDKVGFDGLIKIALDRLTRDLGLGTPLAPGTIHVAGHSAGGLGILEATERGGGASALADKVQDVTLQDAGYTFGWQAAVDWLLQGSPGKTVRVLISEAEQGSTRNVLKQFNVAAITESITRQKKSDVFEVRAVSVPAAKDQKPRPGGFVLESHLVVKDKKTGAVQGTMVAFFAPGGGHYETATATMAAAAAAGPKTTTDFLGEARPGKYRVVSAQAPVFTDKDLGKPFKQAPTGRGGKASDLVLARDTVVEVTALEAGTPATPKGATARSIARVKVAGGEGWVPLSRLAPTKP